MRRLIYMYLFLLTWLPSAHALELADTVIPETVTLHTDTTALILNGAGIRRKFFLRIYVGALYLPQPADNPAAIYAMPGAKRISMHIVHSELSTEKMTAAWTEGLGKNIPAEQFQAFGPRIAQFNNLLPTLHQGDRVDIDTLPGIGTQVWLNDRLCGTVEGDDFAQALLSIWLGEHPADEGLKQALLGKE